MLSVSLWLISFVRPAIGCTGAGRSETGSSTETNLPDKFSLDPNDPNSNLLWKAPYGCRSTPLVMAGKVYIINDDPPEGDPTEGERVMAFDANTGKVLWEHKFNVFLRRHRLQPRRLDQPGRRPDHPPIYAHGTQGFLMCLDGETGKLDLAAVADRGVRPGHRLRRPERQPDRRRRPGHHRHHQRQLGRPGPRRQPLRRLRQEHRRGRLVVRAGRRPSRAPITPTRSSRKSTASGC